jgi:hypothetical protein
MATVEFARPVSAKEQLVETLTCSATLQNLESASRRELLRQP